MKSFKLIEKENSNHFERNIKFYKNVINRMDFRIIDLIEKNDIIKFFNYGQFKHQ